MKPTVSSKGLVNISKWVEMLGIISHPFISPNPLALIQVGPKHIYGITDELASVCQSYMFCEIINTREMQYKYFK